jgi:hypothetical protein
LASYINILKATLSFLVSYPASIVSFLSANVEINQHLSEDQPKTSANADMRLHIKRLDALSVILQQLYN